MRQEMPLQESRRCSYANFPSSYSSPRLSRSLALTIFMVNHVTAARKMLQKCAPTAKPVFWCAEVQTAVRRGKKRPAFSRPFSYSAVQIYFVLRSRDFSRKALNPVPRSRSDAGSGTDGGGSTTDAFST